MQQRQIVLDTETTGLRVEDGHRIIEIGCVEMIDRKLTQKTFHHYINPEREVEPGALAVHGITNEFLQGKPVFSDVVQAFIEFIDGCELIIHNASFDLSFINNELILARQQWKTVIDYCRVTDTLQMARQLHVGQRNSLDALCKRYGIDNTKREFHGALLDAHLLAQVYLAMTGGQGSFFDTIYDNQNTRKQHTVSEAGTVTKHQLIVIKANEEESAEHEKYLKHMKEVAKCLWLEELYT